MKESAISSAPSFYLCWVDDEGVAEERDLAQGEVVIGRSSSCDLVLDDSAVSREHVRIEINGETAVLHDLSSRNGTWVNGERAETVNLESGDEIAVGRMTLVLMSF